MHSRQPDCALLSRYIAAETGIRHAAILIKDGIILDLVEPETLPADCPVEDFGTLAILPGLVDPHVHLHTPGLAENPDFDSATRAAAAGGVTTLVDMPINGEKSSTKAHSIKQKRRAGEGQIRVDCGFYGGVVPQNQEQLEPLLSEGVLGLKAYLIDPKQHAFSRMDENSLRKALPVIARHNVPLLVHSEMKQDSTYDHNSVAASIHDYRQFLNTRPKTWENRAVHRLIRMAKETPAHIHIVPLSSADTAPALREARSCGLRLTIETCPHYLFFAAEDIANSDTRFKCTPPIREQDNRELLWQALTDGVIDFIASGHVPAQASSPNGVTDFQQAPEGFPSLQFSLPAMWTAARQRGFSLPQLVSWLCTKPAEFLGLERIKGKIAPGHQADLVIFDTEKSYRVSRDLLVHKDQATPYEGQTLWGQVVATYLRGEKIYYRGGFAAAPGGQILQKTG